MNTLRLGIDGISQATPLDTFKTSVRAGHSVEQIMQYPIYSGILAALLAMGKSRLAGLAACGCYGRKRFAGIFPSAS
ncbi:electron transport complex protein [Escherichia coli]|uniref:Electron transport complex protein n=1 Tax=Escherichia coli TaxID=562 RepID=A0A2X3JHA6_ECOLX|nr:electron transport complex protein [Escherichia coli]